ncbi:hypothetical protein GC194_13080 [bacterium]|nr:hypothetical protein [bacterium]
MKNQLNLILAALLLATGVVSCTKSLKTHRKLKGTWLIESYVKDSSFYNEDKKAPINAIHHELSRNSLLYQETYYTAKDNLVKTGDPGVVDSCYIRFKPNGSYLYHCDASFVMMPYEDVLLQRVRYEGVYIATNDSVFIKPKSTSSMQYIVRDGDTITTEKYVTNMEEPLMVKGRFKIDELSKDRLNLLMNRAYKLKINFTDSTTTKCSHKITAEYTWTKK